jgi:hypothetical protein
MNLSPFLKALYAYLLSIHYPEHPVPPTGNSDGPNELPFWYSSLQRPDLIFLVPYPSPVTPFTAQGSVTFQHVPRHGIQ